MEAHRSHRSRTDAECAEEEVDRDGSAIIENCMGGVNYEEDGGGDDSKEGRRSGNDEGGDSDSEYEEDGGGDEGEESLYSNVE